MRVPFSPGEILLALCMEPLRITQNGLADIIKTDRRRINEIIKQIRPVTPDTALRLAKVFNTTPEFWMNLQNRHNLYSYASRLSREDLEKIESIPDIFSCKAPANRSSKT